MFNVDVKYLKEVFRKDKGQLCVGCLILVNEKVSKVYDVKFIVSIICDEVYDCFESCESIFGYVQQGGVLFVMDWCCVVCLVIKCI